MTADRFDVIILGGGAAGLFCAAKAGAGGKSVLILERNREVGAKILISGGGRCNFTNLHTAPDRFVSDNPRFAASALARFTPSDIIAYVQGRNIAFYEKAQGQLFCEGAGAARKLLAALAQDCFQAGVTIQTGTDIGQVRNADGAYIVETSAGAFKSPNLVLATGGLSIPKLGASDLSHRLAGQFGLRVTPLRPGLAPLVVGTDTPWRALSGVSAPIRAKAARGPAFLDAGLITHRGLSGPAILQISSYWREGEAIAIDWLPHEPATYLAERKRLRPQAQPRTALSEALPHRLAAALSTHWPTAALGDIRDTALVELLVPIKQAELTPTGTEGFAKAEVTVGGIDTADLHQATMAARPARGLYVIGEAVDMTGWLGGYNFQWAWASAAAAAADLICS